MRKLLMAALALTMLFGLSGCQCGHEWTDADCVNPQICTKCGETSGEALGHTWKEANYQDPEICTVCGETQGSPLPASFEEHGLTINLHENKHYLDRDSGEDYLSFEPVDGFPYLTGGYDVATVKSIGNAYVCNYRIFELDETHLAYDGYEWRAVDFELEFYDDNARNYGFMPQSCYENYYDIEGWDNDSTESADTPWGYLIDQADEYSCHRISYHGESYLVPVIWENVYGTGWQNKVCEDGSVIRNNVSCCSVYTCVPVGYDGVVIGFYDCENAEKWTDNTYIYDIADENTIFFRMGDPDESIQAAVEEYTKTH